MRVLLGDGDDLRSLYAAPDQPWLRVNMVSTVDGAATGDDGTSRSINNGADKLVFDLLRELCDAIVVGRRHRPGRGVRRRAQAAGRRVPHRRRCRRPSAGRGARSGADGDGVDRAPPRRGPREVLGEDNVLVLGSHRVDLARLKDELVLRGFRHLLSEGGPHLLRDLLDQGVADELDATLVPRVVSGSHRRITDGPPSTYPSASPTLAEQDGTLLARWFVAR